MNHKTTSELEAGLDHIRQSPKNNGRLQLIVRRPAKGKREVLQEGQLDLAEGLIGDGWLNRSPNPDAQVTVMNFRMVGLLDPDPQRWPLAGDQLYVDLDLGADNLPPGTRLAIGSAILEVTALPHTGCAQFMERFGKDALVFVNSPEGKKLHLRGINTTVIQAGKVKVGDFVVKK